MDFWKRYLNSDDYKLHSGYFYYSNENPKKYLCYNNSDSAPFENLPTSYTRGNAYEIEFSMDTCWLANYFILDIDYRDKKNQRAFVKDNKLLKEYLQSTNDLYSEYTLNGGVHVVIGCTSKFTIMKEKNTICYTNKNPTPYVFEFKRKCLMWPTNGYEPLVQPVCKIQKHTPEIILGILDKILGCFNSKASHVTLETPVWTRILSFQTCSREIPDIDLLPNVELSDGDDGDDQQAPRKLTVVEVLGFDEYITVGNQGDGGTEDDQDPNNNNKRSQSDSGPSSKKKKLPVGTETVRRVAKECVDNMVSCGMPITRPENDSFSQMDTGPFEYQCDNVFRKKFILVVENIQRLPDEFAKSKCSYLSGITTGVEKLHKYICTMSMTDKPRIYGEHVRTFLHYMLRADDKVTDIMKEGVYHPLKATVPWLHWTYHYCHLIIILEHIHHSTSGRNSQIKKFDEYALYREITLRNEVGARETEEFAYNEYLEQKSKVSSEVCDKYVDCWSTFESFILFTLSVIAINCKVVTAFNYYVDYINLKCDVDMYMDLFLFVELKNYDYKIRFILEEFENGNFEPVAVFSFKNYHWIKANSDLFKCFVQKCFPNLEKVDALIKCLNKQDRSSAYIEEYGSGAETTPFKCWQNIIPFRNGVFDFVFFNKALQNLDKKQQSPRNKLQQIPLYDIDPAHNIVPQDNRTVSKRLSDNPQDLRTIRIRHNVSITPEDLAQHENFSMFRNFCHADSVLSPIDQSFSIDSYMATFKSTQLLSLDNYERYSDKFCMYIKCLFGNSAQEGGMGPFQYTRMLVTFILLSQCLLRTKIFQKSLNIIGVGSNGKSQFMDILKRALGDKIACITSKRFFEPNETQQQNVDLDEVMFTYDAEADTVALTGFKSYVTDSTAQLTRKLWKGIDRNRKNLSSTVLCSNLPVRYTSATQHPANYDTAFHRRVVVLPFYNILGKKSSPIEARVKERQARFTAAGQQESLLNNNCVYDDDDTTGRRPDMMDSLLKRANYDIKKPEVVKKIYEGLIYYFLDCIHVFNLANLNATSNDYVESSFANQRLLIAASNPFLSALFEKYVCLDQIYSTQAEIDDHEVERVDLAVFFYENVKTSYLQAISLTKVCEEFVTGCAGIEVERRGVITTMLDMSNAGGPPKDDSETTTINPWKSEIGKFFARGLVLKTQLSYEQEQALKNPNFLYPMNALADEVDFKRVNLEWFERYIFQNVPIGHRFFFNDQNFKRQMLSVIYKLCTNGKVIPQQLPLKQSTWMHCELRDLLN